MIRINPLTAPGLFPPQREGFRLLSGPSEAASLADIRAQELAETLRGRPEYLPYISSRYALIQSLSAEECPASCYGEALQRTTRSMVKAMGDIDRQIRPCLVQPFSPSAESLRPVAESEIALPGYLRALQHIMPEHLQGRPREIIQNYIDHQMAPQEKLNVEIQKMLAAIPGQAVHTQGIFIQACLNTFPGLVEYVGAGAQAPVAFLSFLHDMKNALAQADRQSGWHGVFEAAWIICDQCLQREKPLMLCPAVLERAKEINR